ncbi:hypothetical protein N7468_000115 [Penicillium chermesinum]|uniref:Type 1 phosphatases regulator n=1 Tax=Penicillium chermesinum TaxID=63820 RepID=A0A9W9PMN8_9EURO|nr:uncharacterized protein N7468_000115 [Penicillium chermesinum]KAJ5248664.1 hypothetical protein N7468_000115 [Penicillium chermesinum]
MSRVRQAANPSHTRTATEPAQESAARLSGTLRLRGDDTPTVAPEPSAARRIRWSEDVVDNEGMGKKSSKEPGPWEKAVQNLNLPTLAPTLIVTAKSIVEGNEHAVPTIHIPEEENHPQKGPPRDEASGDCCSRHHRHARSKPKRKPSPNAYEKMPKPSKNKPRDA